MPDREPIEQLRDAAVMELRGLPHVSKFLEAGRVDDAINLAIDTDRTNGAELGSTLDFLEADYGYSLPVIGSPQASYYRWRAASALVEWRKSKLEDRHLDVRRVIGNSAQIGANLLEALGPPNAYQSEWDVGEQLVMIVENVRVSSIPYVRDDYLPVYVSSVPPAYPRTLEDRLERGRLFAGQLEKEILGFLAYRHAGIRPQVSPGKLLNFFESDTHINQLNREVLEAMEKRPRVAPDVDPRGDEAYKYFVDKAIRHSHFRSPTFLLFSSNPHYLESEEAETLSERFKSSVNSRSRKLELRFPLLGGVKLSGGSYFERAKNIEGWEYGGSVQKSTPLI